MKLLLTKLESAAHRALPSPGARVSVQAVACVILSIARKALPLREASAKVPLLHRVGDRFYRLGDFEAAAVSFERQIRKSPTDFLAHYNGSRALSKLGRVAEAIGLLEQACQLNSRSAGAWFELGRNYQRLSRYQQALSSFARAFEVNPSHCAAVAGYVEELLRIRKVTEALVVIKSAALNLGTEQRAHYLAILTEVSLAADDLDVALKSVEEFLQTDPNNPRALLSLARLLRAHNKIAEAHELCKRIFSERLAQNSLQQSPVAAVSALSFVDLGRAFQKLHFDDIAVAAFETALKQPNIADQDSVRVEVLRDLGKSLNRIKQFDRALTVLLQALKIRDDSRTVRELAKAYSFLGRLSDATAVLAQFGARHPADSLILYERARILYNFGRYSESHQAISSAFLVDPSNALISRFKDVVAGSLNVYEERKFPTLIYSFPYRGTELKVLHLLETSLPHKRSGYTYRSHYVLTSQRKLGFDPVAVTRAGFPADSGIGGGEARDVLDGISYLRTTTDEGLGYNKYPLDVWLQRHADQVLRIALDERPEILHGVSNFKNGLVARAVARTLMIPFVYELRGIWEDTQVSKGILDPTTERYTFFRSMEDECLHSADAVVTISETLRDEIAERGVSAERVFVVPNAVDVEKFPLVGRDEQLAAELQLGSGTVFGYISSFVAYEGIDLLIRAFSKIQKTLPSARLLLVGDGDELPHLKRLVRELELTEKVHLTGRVEHSEVIRYYSLIDIFVVPRLPLRVCEIVTPLKPYEAMSTGRALMVSDVKALREMVVENQTGVYFRAGDADSLAAVGTELAHSPERRQMLGQNAARWVREHRTWERVAATYCEAYAFARLGQASRKRSNPQRAS